MGRSSFALCLLIAVWAVVATQETEKYPDTFDNVSIDNILKNDVERDQLFQCIFRGGPCRSDYANFWRKRHPEILRTYCGKCTDKQKATVKKVNTWFRQKSLQERCSYIEKVILRGELD